jgi:predicted RNase H-like HicB family nuclease
VKYRIALYQSDEGYCADALALPGCWSQGATNAEALENIKGAILEYLEVRSEMVRDAEMREVEVC